jgi:hypothetical protein
MTPDTIRNARGGRYIIRNGSGRRADRTTLEFKGHTFEVDYFTDGEFMAATETDPAEFPTCTVKTVELSAMGRAADGTWVRVLVNVSDLMAEHFDEIADRIERSWK